MTGTAAENFLVALSVFLSIHYQIIGSSFIGVLQYKIEGFVTK
ncbi:hypothetical protein RV15_GL003595 [Enterococcus silesiacus]|uniref:Uncharacterized protein n=1 Tax=Enterococcus silesiacus TaxID=332949 RepID=A0AA91GHV2_9ENTE|nr:hypothetical protein [Enterococcus silesiacus]OJG91950.1 hypothetical protein RV15_GL003595 [Enterococcus silesiacus]